MRLYTYAIKFYTNIPLLRRSRNTILRNRRSRSCAGPTLPQHGNAECMHARGTRPRKRTHACRHSGACMQAIATAPVARTRRAGPRRSCVPAARDRDVARGSEHGSDGSARPFRGSDGAARPFCGSEWHHLSPASQFCGRDIFSQFFSMHVYKRKTLKTKVYIQIFSYLIYLSRVPFARREV